VFTHHLACNQEAYKRGSARKRTQLPRSCKECLDILGNQLIVELACMILLRSRQQAKLNWKSHMYMSFAATIRAHIRCNYVSIIW
jgi:hypothetical protein